MRAVRPLVWIAGVVLMGAMLAGALHAEALPTGQAIVHYGIAGVIAITVSVLVWGLRPESRTGALMTAAAFAGALSELGNVFPESAPAVTVGYAAFQLGVPLLAQLVLSYPTGRLTSRLERRFVAVVYGFAAAYGLALLLFHSPRAPRDPIVWECPSCALPITHVAWLDTTGITHVLDGVLIVLVGVFLVLLVRKLVRAAPASRRVVLPLFATMVVVAARAVVAVGIVFLGGSADFWTSSALFWTETVATLAIPLSLAAGMLWAQSARSAAADFVVELEHTPPGSVRDALARTLGDPSLELALWLPERGAYVDGDGRPLVLPDRSPDRAVTLLGAADAPVAALIHDPVLLERRALLAAVGAAARLALENERLQADLRAQLAELRASRARIFSVGDEERRRLERDLHDGAQQRLLALGLALQLSRARLAPDANGAAELLDEADAELRAALDELRELARGIHPAVLTEHGLASALSTVAERSPVPVTITELPAGRLPAPTEAAAYFMVSEALANVAKYAHASRVRVRVVHEDGRALVDVEDDGVGGADPTRGSGLRGLCDRIQALDGELAIESPPGSGTHLHAEIPCA
jgi:signal transduction histidine kinase